MEITKQMLSIQTRKSILYLDQNFLSAAFRGINRQWDTAMQRIRELLDLQLLAAPYSSIHESEAELWDKRSEDLRRFIHTVARGHSFEPYYRVEKTQILKAFQRYLAKAPASYLREERDAISPSVHDWDGPFFVSLNRPALEVEPKKRFKQRAVEELAKTLGAWASNTNTFEQNVDLELRDAARLLVKAYEEKAARLQAGDFSALLNSSVDASVVEAMLYILHLKGTADPATVIRSFFSSDHFAQVPCQQLSARLFSAFKKRVREGAYTNREKATERLSGFLFDVQHAATYAPYCDGFFTDRFMRDLMSDPNVAVEKTFGCKAFAASNLPEFLSWLDGVESRMTAEHADALTWAYSKHRPKRARG